VWPFSSMFILLSLKIFTVHKLHWTHISMSHHMCLKIATFGKFLVTHITFVQYNNERAGQSGPLILPLSTFTIDGGHLICRSHALVEGIS